MPEHYVDIDRRSPMLLPVDMRDWVARDRLAQLVIDTIEQWDLRRAVTNDRGTGSRQYPPGMMVSLLIYAYAQGVFSSRRIERLTYENLSFRYVCANTHPDHDTIAKFRRENAALFQDCMRAIIEVPLMSSSMLAFSSSHPEDQVFLPWAQKDLAWRASRPVDVRYRLEAYATLTGARSTWSPGWTPLQHQSLGPSGT